MSFPAIRPSEDELRRHIVDYCQLMHHKGYLAASDGNVSVRLGNGRILITPSGVHKGFLRPEDLIIVNEHGHVLEGDGRPSGEIAMHLTALARRPDVQAVVHAHPPTCIAVSLLRHLRLNGILPEVILSVGTIEIVPYARPISEDLAASLEGHIDRHDALILERHGTITVGRSVHHAYALVERLEHAAEVLRLAHAIGKPVPLPDAEIHALTELYERSRA